MGLGQRAGFQQSPAWVYTTHDAMGNDLDGDDVTRRARAGADPDHLLPGEKPDTQDREAIETWITVYEELLSEKQGMADTLREKLPGFRPEVAAELEYVDLGLLKHQMRRLEARRDFWRRKRSR